MDKYIYKRLDKLERQVPITKILFFHNQWKHMTEHTRTHVYENKFVLYLRKNRTFRNLLILNSIFIHVQKHFDSIFSTVFCPQAKELLFLLSIKISETEKILEETNYGLTENEIKKKEFTKRVLEKTKLQIILFLKKESSIFFQIFYKGSANKINCFDMIHEIYSFLDFQYNFHM
jgi:hypothetical protein